MATARDIANKNPHAIRAAKRVINHQRHVDAATGILEESVEQMKIMRTPNQIEAVMANMQKRDPKFID